MESYIKLILKHRLMLIIGLLVIIVIGIYSLSGLPIDTFPDVTPIMVQIFIETPGLAPQEVEQLVTIPMEAALTGLPNVQQVKSASSFGLSVISIYFDDFVDIFVARQFVNEKLQDAREQLVEGAIVEMGPVTTGMGQILQYIVVSDSLNAMQVRELQDWFIKVRLKQIRGVTQVLSIGGEVKQFQLQFDPNVLAKHGVTVCELVEAVEKNNANSGGSFVEHGSEEYLIRSIGVARNEKDIANILVKYDNGVPVRVTDVASVQIVPEIRRGAQTWNGGKEIVAGNVLKLIGVNTKTLIEKLRVEIASLNKQLPKGTQVVAYYDQSMLVSKSMSTVTSSLIIGAILVMLLLVIFLGNIRTALITILVLPITALFTFIFMKFYGIDGNLMSLGGLAIALGMLVDGTIVVIENIWRHFSSNQSQNRNDAIVQGAKEVIKPVIFAVLIIVIVFLPLFTLTGVEGKLFKPMAFTIAFAMLGSLIMAVIFVPAIASYVLVKTKNGFSEKITEKLQMRFEPMLLFAEKRRKLIIGIAVFAMIVSFGSVPFLGTEFVPTLEEGNILIRAVLAPSASLEQTVKTVGELEKDILSFDEVENVVSRIGSAEVGGCAEPVNNAEIHINLKPFKKWNHFDSKAELIEKMEEKLSHYPGVNFQFSQPIQNRINELLSGTRADLAIRLYGDDLTVLVQKGNEIKSAVESIEGIEDLQVEQLSGQPQLQILIDRTKAAQFGINIDEINEIVEVALGSGVAGQVLDNNKRYDVTVRLMPEFRSSVSDVGKILIPSADGQLIPLAMVADIRTLIGPKLISREDASRKVTVSANVRGRDMGSLVEECRARIDENVDLPAGYFVKFGGQFENQERAMRRLSFIVPLTLFLILLLLYKSFDNLRDAAVVACNLPFALIGGIIALWIGNFYLSVPAVVGFIGLFGVAVENGIVLVECARDLRKNGASLHNASMRAAILRLRPVLITAGTTVLGLLPLLLSHGIGAEIQKPLAAVMIGGLLTSTFATLIVLPIVYIIFPMRAMNTLADV